MPKILYQEVNFKQATLKVISEAVGIIEEYQAEGYDLTLRQLYYQFVARDLFPEDRRWTWTGKRWKRDPNGTKNAEPNYKWTGIFINNARLSGMIDWESIIDRTRKVRNDWHWDNPEEIIENSADSYHIDTRATQEIYLEVWVEKDALVGILERACEKLGVAYLSCRGYVSQSAMWRAARRVRKQELNKAAIILHLGDHDPSGIDMTRDIQDRLRLFRSDVTVERIALNMNQIKKYNPPPNFAKPTDSRYSDYKAIYGDECWELDALDPRTITKLIESKVNKYTDKTERQDLIDKQESDREKLRELASNF